MIEDLITAGQWREGDPDVLVVFDAGYDAPRLAHLLNGLPAEVLVACGRTAREAPTGRPRAHGEEVTVDSETEPVVVKLGVWIPNTKTRRDKLTADQHAALTKLGVDWA